MDTVRVGIIGIGNMGSGHFGSITSGMGHIEDLSNAATIEGTVAGDLTEVE